MNCKICELYLDKKNVKWPPYSCPVVQTAPSYLMGNLEFSAKLSLEFTLCHGPIEFQWLKLKENW